MIYKIYYVYDKINKKYYYDFCNGNVNIIDLDTNIRRHYKNYKDNKSYNKQFTELFKNMYLEQVKYSKKYHNKSIKKKQEIIGYNIDTHILKIKNNKRHEIYNNLNEEDKLTYKSNKKVIKDKLKELKIDFKKQIEEEYDDYLELENDNDNKIRDFIDNILYKNKYLSIDYSLGKYYYIDDYILDNINDIYLEYITNKHILEDKITNLLSLSEEDLKNIKALHNKVLKDKKFYKIGFSIDIDRYNEDKKYYAISETYWSNNKGNYIKTYTADTRKDMRIIFNKYINDKSNKKGDKVIKNTKNIYDPNKKCICDICGKSYTYKNKQQHLKSKKCLKIADELKNRI
tara:strand:+ start:1135 stop:2166 length:1032 start_codon:yes stop_codon:yes gene_type:complete